MSHYGPRFETHDITGWTAEELVSWLWGNPRWNTAEIKTCGCDFCGEVVELVMPEGTKELGPETAAEVRTLHLGRRASATVSPPLGRVHASR